MEAGAEVSWELETCTEGDVTVLVVRGDVDGDAARSLLDRAAAEAGDRGAVQIDLDGVDSLSDEAAALLLFRRAPGPGGRGVSPTGPDLPAGISLRTSRPPGRQAVLAAYARRRGRSHLGA